MFRQNGIICDEIICLAKPDDSIERTYPGYSSFFKEFRSMLECFHKVIPLALPDIWLRDFMPVHNPKDGKFYQFFFNPNYANYVPSFNERIRNAVQEMFPYAERLPLRIDGGNIINNSKVLFCFSRPSIFRKSAEGERQQSENLLQKAFGKCRIAWLPKEAGDKVCHIDGFMQFLGNKLFVSDEGFEPYLSGLLKKRLEIIKNFLPNAEIIFLPCGSRSEKLSMDARGIYVNFLETSRAVFIPQYGLPEDEEAFSIIKKHADKPVIGIDCSGIAAYGGAVHCLTREYPYEALPSLRS